MDLMSSFQFLRTHWNILDLTSLNGPHLNINSVTRLPCFFCMNCSRKGSTLTNISKTLSDLLSAGMESILSIVGRCSKESSLLLGLLAEGPVLSICILEPAEPYLVSNFVLFLENLDCCFISKSYCKYNRNYYYKTAKKFTIHKNHSSSFKRVNL